MVYIGARDYEIRKEGAQRAAQEIEQRYKSNQISAQKAAEELEKLQTGSKYNRVDLGDVTEKVKSQPIRQIVDPIIAAQKEIQTYGYSPGKSVSSNVKKVEGRDTYEPDPTKTGTTLYEVKYKGKTYLTSNPEFKPEEYRKDLQEFIRKQKEAKEKEEAREKSRAELFSYKARAALGITGSEDKLQGMMIISEGGRKRYVQTVMEEKPTATGGMTQVLTSRVVADVPSTATYSPGFESKLGKKEEAPKDEALQPVTSASYGSRFASSLLGKFKGFGSSLAKGYGKFAYVENLERLQGVEPKETATFLDMFPKKLQAPFNWTSSYFDTKLSTENLLKDPDVRAAGLFTGISVGAAASRFVSGALDLGLKGLIGYSSYKFVREPTPERLADVAFYSTPFLIKGAAKLKQKYFTPTKVKITSKQYKQPVAELEKTVSTGKKITTSQQGDGTLFEYPRVKSLVKSTGKNAPSVVISRGTVSRGKSVYDLYSVQVGRSVYGRLASKDQTILFQKSVTGDISLKYLTSKGKVIKTATVAYAAEPMKITQKNVVFSGKPTTVNVDVGKKVDTQTLYDFRNIVKKLEYKAVGAETQFKGLRDVSKSYKGKATSLLVQSDKALPQKEVVKVGSDLVVTLKQPDIRYSLQPIYQPNTKYYNTITTKQGVIPVSEYIQKPQLFTQRRNYFTSESSYTYTQSGIKPIKGLVKAVEGLDKSGKVYLTSSKVGIPTQEPTVTPIKQQVQAPLSGETTVKILEKSPDTLTTPVIFQTAEPTKQVSVLKSIVTPAKKSIVLRKSKLSQESLPESITDVEVRPLSEITTKPRTKTTVRSLTKVSPEIKTATATKTATTTKTVTQTRALTKTPAASVPNLQPSPSTIRTPTVIGIGSSKLLGGSKEFTVSVRRKGVFREIGKFSNPVEAFAKGKAAVLSTAAASFKVEQGKEKISPSAVVGRILPRNIFRRSKREANVFVQRRERRISSPGEKREITARGIFATRQSRRKSNLFNIFRR